MLAFALQKMYTVTIGKFELLEKGELTWGEEGHEAQRRFAWALDCSHWLEKKDGVRWALSGGCWQCSCWPSRCDYPPNMAEIRSCHKHETLDLTWRQVPIHLYSYPSVPRTCWWILG